MRRRFMLSANVFLKKQAVLEFLASFDLPAAQQQI